MPDHTHKPGPTGRYPFGVPQRPDDKGELCTRMGIENGKILVDFGVPVKWLIMPADQAEAFANGLLKRVKELRGK